MQTMLQLNPPIPMCTPKGEGLAVLVIDYGPDYDLWWTVIVGKGEFAGQIWTYPNPQVRGVTNVSLGREMRAAPPLASNGRPTDGHQLLPREEMRPHDTVPLRAGVDAAIAEKPMNGSTHPGVEREWPLGKRT